MAGRGGDSGGSTNTPFSFFVPAANSPSILTAGLRAGQGFSTLLGTSFKGLQQKAKTVKSSLLGG